MPERGSALSRPAREPSQQTESGLILPDSAKSLVSYHPRLKHQALVRICMMTAHADWPKIAVYTLARQNLNNGHIPDNQEIISSHAVICTQEVLVADTAPDQAEEAASLDDNVMLDWKGDPMQINPGDKLPFSFK